METTTQPLTAPAVPEPEPRLSAWGRSVAVFARPAQAWAGLERRGQWWFPLVLCTLVSVLGTGLTYQRAIVPTMLAQFDRQVEAGQIPPTALDRIERQVSGPAALAMNLASVVVVLPLMSMAFAVLPWLAAGFMLGHRFRYRDAFVVTAWAGLVTIPAQILTSALAWTNETMTNLHVGFGVLLPIEEPPSKLMVGLGTFLDQGIGPFALWYLVVLALGAAALSGGKPPVRDSRAGWHLAGRLRDHLRPGRRFRPGSLTPAGAFCNSFVAIPYRRTGAPACTGAIQGGCA